MQKSLAPFFSLLLSTGILLIGNGLFGTLVSVRADLESFSDMMIGAIGAAYFAGFMAGCIYAPRVVRSVGHIRSFAAFASLASVAPLVQGLFHDPVLWLILRIVTGYCFAGLYTIIESWLNDQASNDQRGGLLGLYLVVNLGAITIGQLLLNLAPPGDMTLFITVSALTSLSLVPVALTRSVQPAPIESVSMDFRALWNLSPVGFAGCFVVGLTNGPFWTLGPIYARHVGLDVQGVSIFMTVAILAGALFQVPAGRLSDRMDRRWIIALVSLCAGAGALALAWLAEPGAAMNVYVASGLFGGFALSLYGICIAQANDHATSDQFVVIAGGLLLAFSAGAVIGPLVISALLPVFGIGFVYGFPAVIFVVYAAFVLTRIVVRAAVPADDRESFVAVPVSRTSPVPYELDPRSDGDDRGSRE